jgi:hypothetical protein
MTYAYSCESTPLYEVQTYPCPNGFFPFKNECLNPNQLLTDYDTATVNNFYVFFSVSRLIETCVEKLH